MDPSADVVWMVRGLWVSLSLRAACELGVMDVLTGPRTLDELAGATATHAPTLSRLLRVLVDLGLVTEEDSRYAATPRGALLRTDDPSGLRSLALMQTVLPNLTAWHSLADAVREGGAVYQRLHGMSSWEHLAAHPEEAADFNAAMARRGGLQVEAVLAAADLAPVHLLVDVGGGEGAMLAGLLAAAPALHGLVADRPDVAAAATEALAAAGFGERAQGVPADFFTSVPAGGDVYALANVLHDWDDAEAVAILRTVGAAMAAGARLWIVENVLDAPGRTFAEQRDLHLVDLHMLVLFGARERTKVEYDALLVEAGFEPSTLADTGTVWNVLESRPV